MFYNANPDKEMVGDCTVRALSNVMGLSWDEVYIGLVTYGYILKDMPSRNRVWQEYLNDNGYNRYAIHDQLWLRLQLLRRCS